MIMAVLLLLLLLLLLNLLLLVATYFASQWKVALPPLAVLSQ